MSENKNKHKNHKINKQIKKKRSKTKKNLQNKKEKASTKPQSYFIIMRQQNPY